MSTSPVVSVVTAFYNRARYIPASVGSLLDQTLADIEVIVVNDGSTDDTAEQLAQFDDPRLIALNQENVGFVVSMNRAIRSSRGRYVAIHGSGDRSLPERFEKQAAFLDANPEVGLVGCMRRAGREQIGTAGPVKRGNMLAQMLVRNPFSHGEVMFRRDLFDKVGGYREVFKFAQDRDLWLRMGRYCDYAILPDVLYEHEHIADGVSKTPRHYYMQSKLSQFAVQCAESRDDRGRDLLDRFGSAALFLTQPSKTLSKRYTERGLRALRDGDFDAADMFLRVGWREDTNLITLAGVVVRRLGRQGWARGPLRALLRLGTPKKVADD